MHRPQLGTEPCNQWSDCLLFLHVIKMETLVWMSKLNKIHPFIGMTPAIKAWNMCPVFNQGEKYCTEWMSCGKHVWVEPLSVSLHTAQWPLVSPIFQPSRQAANVSAYHKYHDVGVIGYVPYWHLCKTWHSCREVKGRVTQLQETTLQNW